MKKFFLVLLLVTAPTQYSFASYDQYFQGLWQNLSNRNYEEIDQTFSGRLISDIDFDHQYDGSSRKDEYNEMKTTTRLASRVRFNKNIFLNSNFVLGRMPSASDDTRRSASVNGGGDRTFEDLGVIVRELALSYSNNDMAIIAGKFNPNFGTAWRWGRGIWARDLAQNYRQVEKLGFGGMYKVGDKQKTGRYSFGFSAFTNDRKNLDNTLINQRDSDHKYDGKPGDTRSLQSYVASLDINFDFKNGEELVYHFAYENLAVNERASSVSATKIDNQKGFVAGGNYRYPIRDNFLLDGLLEYTDLKNVSGNSDISEKYFNANIVLEFYRNWNVTLATAMRQNVQIDQNGFDQNLSEISFGYKFDKNRFFDQLLLQAGYKNLRTNYKTSFSEINALGVLARYIKSF